MRDTTSTPIIRYSGPSELRKGLEMEGRKFLGYVKGVLGGGLPYQKYVGRYNDGTTIEVQSMSHTGDVDLINIVVPREVIVTKEEKEKKVRTEVTLSETIQIIPMLIEIPDKDHLDTESICSWASPKFNAFTYFFQEPPNRPIYTLITSGPTEEINLREFKDSRDGTKTIAIDDEDGTPSYNITHIPNVPAAPDEWPEGSYNNIQYSYSGSWSETSSILLPDSSKVADASLTYNVDVSTQWGMLGPNESDYYFYRWVISASYCSVIGSSITKILSYFYVDESLYAVLYVKTYQESSGSNPAQDGGWAWQYFIPPTQPVPPDSPYDDPSINITDTEVHYGLYLTYYMGDEIETITLPPIWDADCEWEVSQGYVAIYKEKVIVYSYLKTEKSGGGS